MRPRVEYSFVSSISHIGDNRETSKSADSTSHSLRGKPRNYFPSLQLKQNYSLIFKLFIHTSSLCSSIYYYSILAYTAMATSSSLSDIFCDTNPMSSLHN